MRSPVVVIGIGETGSVNKLREDRRGLAQAVAHEVIRSQEALSGREFDDDRLVDAIVVAFAGDPELACTGRSAPVHLARAHGGSE